MIYETWRLTRTVPPLGPDEAQIWRFLISHWRSHLPILRDQLTPDEHSRAARFIFAGDAERFVVARGALRGVLSASLGCEPRAIRFKTGPYGKPLQSHIQFNVTHSGDVVLIILHRRKAVGADVERVDSRIDMDALMQSSFARREHDVVVASPHARQAFFRIWVRKEAWLKATGLGLSFPLTNVDVSRVGCPVVRNSPFGGSCLEECCVVDLHAADGYAAAWAITGNLQTVSLWDSGEGDPSLLTIRS